MKKHLLLMPLLASLLLFLPSCDDYDYWDPEPPYGVDNFFYDSDLNGCWQLYQVNSNYVRDDQVNYMQFYGNGRGRYFYYDRGYEESEDLAYWCQYAGSGNSSLLINIDYEFGNPSTMNYWFSNADTLWMQWSNAAGVQTYVYKYYGRYAPW